MNWNAHYTTGWSAESATNGEMDGGVFINMLPKDQINMLPMHIHTTHVHLANLTGASTLIN